MAIPVLYIGDRGLSNHADLNAIFAFQQRLVLLLVPTHCPCMHVADGPVYSSMPSGTLTTPASKSFPHCC